MKNFSIFALMVIICLSSCKNEQYSVLSTEILDTTMEYSLSTPQLTVAATTQYLSSIVESTVSNITETPSITEETSYTYIGNDLAVATPNQEDLLNIPSIWKAYKISDLNIPEPGFLNIDVNMNLDQPLLIPWSWCTGTGFLNDNLSHIQVKYIFNVIEVPESLFYKYTTDKNYVECQHWVIKLPWIVDNIHFRIKYIIDKEISDGYSSYPKGEYTISFIGRVNYDKQLLSEKYGFGFTLPSDSKYDTVSFYRPDGNDKIFETLYHNQIDNGDIESNISAFAEITKNGCKSKTIEEITLMDKNATITTEYVTINEIYFTKIFTPNNFGEKGKERQIIEYMTLRKDICVHLYVELGINYRGVDPTPNLLNIMKNEILEIVSTFRWINAE
jgi:hypothetical protein